MTTIAAPVHRCPLPAPAIEPSVATAALRHAAADPGAVAVVDGATGETLTRGELAARSAALAAGLRAGGVRPGDLVAVTMPNLAWWPVVALGVWRAGAVISPISPCGRPTSRRACSRAPHPGGDRLRPLRGEHARRAGSAGLHDVDLAVLGGEAGDATPSRRCWLARATPTPSPTWGPTTSPPCRSPAAPAGCPRACASRTATSPRRPSRERPPSAPAAPTTSARSSSPRRRSSTRSASRSCSARR